VVDGRRADRPETQPLDPGLKVEHEGASVRKRFARWSRQRVWARLPSSAS
jgi:hypothetical protein